MRIHCIHKFHLNVLNNIHDEYDHQKPDAVLSFPVSIIIILIELHCITLNYFVNNLKKYIKL